jgi:hypothetical protein
MVPIQRNTIGATTVLVLGHDARFAIRVDPNDAPVDESGT